MISSPLRYPGGKAKLLEYFASIIKENNLYSCTYCEPYAGGAGLAIKLLTSGFVRQVILNDIDDAIFAFWRSVLETPEEFCRMVMEVPVNIDEWHRQQAVWRDQDVNDPLRLGFAAFFLNRTNRSGIIDGAGPIGGYAQDGAWKLDVRLNKQALIATILALADYRDRISISNNDAVDFVASCFLDHSTFTYLDPPYYVKGSKLYRNFYNHEDHCNIGRLLEKNRRARWVVSYDDVAPIREIYARFVPTSYTLNYSAGRKAAGREVIYFSDQLAQPAVTGFKREAA